MIETIMDHEIYKQYPYKFDEVKETINELILYEDDASGSSFKEKEAIAKLNLKF